MPLADAVAHPRVHIDTSGDVVRLKAEPGLDLPDIDLPICRFRRFRDSSCTSVASGPLFSMRKTGST
jgi:hypothetical protein